jgi:nucleoside-diphosphate kinase
MRFLRQRDSAGLRDPLRKERWIYKVILLEQVQNKRPGPQKGFQKAEVGEEEDDQMTPTEDTLIVLKPDAVHRNLLGLIIARFEAKGFTVKRLQMITMTRSQAEGFYGVHKDKPFFGELVSFITSGPVVGVILSGRDAVATVRRMVGSTKSWEAAAGTIRGDFALGLTDNAIHASDSAESFAKESKVFFGM